MLPRIVPSSDPEIWGTTAPTGPVGARVPVCGALGDQQAAMFGQACFNPGDAKNTYGTGCFLLLNTGTQAVVSSKGLLTTVAYQVGNGKPRYALEGSVAIAGSGVQWLRDQLRIINEAPEVGTLATFFDIIHQDPVLSKVKLIAEPWDVGDGGYQVGKFPLLWSEWNGKYRDVVRDFWRGEDSALGEFAARLTGSSDLYEHTGRRPHASINFITAHDGFTLRDLVSYNDKHNDANGEDNRDGESHNRSWNCGAEGDTDDADIRQLRLQQQRNFLATLMLSQGVPMLLAGDEMGRSQHGNNNTYCHDNELSWLNWSLSDEQKDLLRYTQKLVKLIKKHPVFRRRDWFYGREIHGSGIRDIGWFNVDGGLMTDEWTSGYVKTLTVFLNGEEIATPNKWGEQVVDDSFLLMFNAHYEMLEFALPARFRKSDNTDWPDRKWRLLIDTKAEGFVKRTKNYKNQDKIPVAPRSLIVLRSRHQS